MNLHQTFEELRIYIALVGFFGFLVSDTLTNPLYSPFFF